MSHLRRTAAATTVSTTVAALPAAVSARRADAMVVCRAITAYYDQPELAHVSRFL